MAAREAEQEMIDLLRSEELEKRAQEEAAERRKRQDCARHQMVEACRLQLQLKVLTFRRQLAAQDATTEWPIQCLALLEGILNILL